MIDKLAGVHPKLKRAVARILATMAEAGFPMLVTDGMRTTEEQQALYAKGRTKPGKKVTNADGVRVKSNHQLHADGCGHAVDCTFMDEHGKPRWVESDPWAMYGAVAKSQGLMWGGDWKTPDRPHIELPE